MNGQYMLTELYETYIMTAMRRSRSDYNLVAIQLAYPPSM